MLFFQRYKLFNQKRFRIRTLLMLIGILVGLCNCGPERRQDLQESSKVSESDSTHNTREGDKGVGSEGKGYAEEGSQEVATGKDSVSTDTAGIRK